MLADVQIRRLIKEGKITIDPYREEAVKTGNYEVRLGSLLLVPERGQLIDLQSDSLPARYERVALNSEGYILEPQAFILGQTLETFAFSSDISASIDGKSTLARLGISIHQSSTTMSPGQDAHVVTLEIFNAGPFRVRIYPEMPIGKVVFFQSSEENSRAYREHGKYADQKETTGPKIA